MVRTPRESEGFGDRTRFPQDDDDYDPWSEPLPEEDRKPKVREKHK